MVVTKGHRRAGLKALLLFPSKLMGQRGAVLAPGLITPPVRLSTLVNLRWLAVVGQLGAVLFVHFGLGYPTPILLCLALILLSVAINIGLTLFDAGRQRPSHFPSLQLVYDLLQLSGLLALTGGLLNPFSLLLLAPVSVSATTLSRRSTYLLALLVVLLASALSVWHLPLPWDPERTIAFERDYLIGIWVSLVCGVVFIAGYTNRVAQEGRLLAQALATTELALSRHEHLSALDGLAAAAAHELGTPLSTIALAAKEMRSEVPPGPLAEDIDLIIAQSARCRAILAKLRNLGADAGDPFASVPLDDLLAEVARPHEVIGIPIRIQALGGQALGDGGAAPLIRRSVGLLYGLGNLIENAVQFAENEVQVVVRWTDKVIAVSIADDGPGFPPEVLARMGEPYLTTRPRSAIGTEDGAGGLGLGIFIAKTLLERSGAKLAFTNAEGAHHARVEIVWPRHAIETESTAH